MTEEKKVITTENSAPKPNIPKPNMALKNFKFNPRRNRVCFFTDQGIIPDYRDTNFYLQPNKLLVPEKQEQLLKINVY